MKNSEMSHETVTPELDDFMPRHTYLMRRGSKYYLNMKVPKDLQVAIGKELIRKSLRTSEPREAARRVRIEAVKMDAHFERERAKLRNASPSVWHREEIPDGEIQQMARRFLVSLESHSENWWLTEAATRNQYLSGRRKKNYCSRRWVYTIDELSNCQLMNLAVQEIRPLTISLFGSKK